jgi:hypothetical protein
MSSVTLQHQHDRIQATVLRIAGVHAVVWVFVAVPALVESRPDFKAMSELVQQERHVPLIRSISELYTVG